MIKIRAHRNTVRSKWILCGLALLLCFFYTQAKAAEPFSIGQIFETKLTLNNPDKSVIFLPPGKYEVAVYYTWRSLQNNGMSRLTLHQIVKQTSDEKIVKNAVSVMYNTNVAEFGWQESKLCERKNLHFIDKKANYQHEQDCYGLNHYRPTLVGHKNKYIAASGVRLVKRGIRLPQIGLLPFFRFTDNFSMMEIYYFFNPEGYGFEEQERTTWKGSPWHPSGIWNHPQKDKFKNVVLDWTKKYYPTIKKAAWGKVADPFKLPDIISVAHDNQHETVKPTGASSIETTEKKPPSGPKRSEQPSAVDQQSTLDSRLKAVKKLEDAGLISKEEAAAKRKEILKNL
jgi:hypothetical protein